MIVLAIVKASGLRTSANSFDLVWELFWQQVEASVAVSMVSFTAFRSIFVSNKPNAGRKKPRLLNSPHSPFHMLRKRVSAKDQQEKPVSSLQQEVAPHLTLGTEFQQIRQQGIADSRFKDASSIESQSSMNGDIRHNSSVYLNVEHNKTGVTRPKNTVSSDEEFGLDVSQTSDVPTRRTQEINHTRRHWWEMGIISNFTASTSTA